ncbi:MAG TPA: amidohydrolase family protein [Burkholderiales bacterium]
MEPRACLGPRPPAAPRRKPPPGAWDTHFHVLGPQARFPYAASRRYTPPDAPLERLLETHRALGIERGLVVHANTHGFDNRVDLDAVARSQGRYFAVVRLDERCTAAGAAELHAAGARGVRFAFNPEHGGSLDKAAFERVLEAVAPLGWFVELHFEAEALPGLESWLKAIPAVVVIDHIGRVDAGQGVDQEPFRILRELMKRPNFWVKLSGLDRISRRPFPYDDVAPFAAALVEIAADRLIWGSDWPHTGVFDPARMPDDASLLDAFAALVPDDAIRRRILVDNPRRLLGLA